MIAASFGFWCLLCATVVLGTLCTHSILLSPRSSPEKQELLLPMFLPSRLCSRSRAHELESQVLRPPHSLEVLA